MSHISNHDASVPPDQEPPKPILDRSQISLLLLIAAVTAGSICYKLIVNQHLEQTALLFIGLPMLLAVVLALSPRAKTVQGAIAKGITFALLLSGPLLNEGFICIVMASPIFYGIGLFVGAIVDQSKKKSRAPLSCLILLLLPMCLEGVSPELSFNRNETVRATEIVNASASDVVAALSRSPRTDLPLPAYLRLRFPRPTEAYGEGLSIGDTRTIHFAGGEGHPGDLVLRITHSQPGYVRFEAVSDKSKIAHWLDWKSSEVCFTPIDESHTRVIWTIHFVRRLDPAWYFRPWERYATTLAAEYLIRANATPSQPASRDVPIK